MLLSHTTNKIAGSSTLIANTFRDINKVAIAFARRCRKSWLIPRPHIYLEYVVRVFAVLHEGEKCCQNFWQHEILQIMLMKLFRTLRTLSLPCATAVAASSAVFNEGIRLLFSLVPSTQISCPVTLLTSLNLLSLASASNLAAPRSASASASAPAL
jgi:hypothetical protein